MGKFELESLEQEGVGFQKLTAEQQQASGKTFSVVWEALLHDREIQDGFTPEEIGNTAIVLLQLHVSGALGRACREEPASQETDTSQQQL